MSRKVNHQFLLPISLIAILVGAIYILSSLSLTLNEPTRAAADDYAVAGGNPGSLPVVGAASVALPTLTMTDADGDDFSDVDGEEIFEVVINTTDYPSVVFDQTVVFGDLTVAGTCGHTSATVLSFTNATTARVTVSGAGGAATCATGETVTIAGLKIQTVHAQSAPGANELVTVDNAFTSAGSPVATSDTVNLAVTAADAAGSINLPNPTVGVTGITTLSLTIPVDLENNDTVTFTMPNNIEVVGTTFISTTFAGTGFQGCSEAGQAITCTVDTDLTAGTGDIAMTGMTPIYEASASNEVTDLGVNDVSAGEDIATDAFVDVTDTVAATTLTQDINAAAVAKVGDTAGQVTLDITFPVALVTGDTIKITFPDNWDISSLTTGAAQNYNLDNTVDVGVVGQVVTLTLEGAQGATAETINFETDTITPLYEETGQNIATLIEKSAGQDVAASAADTGVNEPIDNTQAADTLGQSVDATAVTQVGDSTGQVTSVLLFPAPLVAGDTIEITFPDNWNISTITTGAGQNYNLDNTVDVAVSGQVLTLTLEGTQGASSETINFETDTITPGYAASSQTIATLIEKAAGQDVVAFATDTGVNISIQDTTAADAAADVNLGSTTTVGVVGEITLDLDLPFALDADDTIDITFPAFVDISAVVAAEVTGTLEGGSNVTCTDAGSQVLTCTTPGTTATGANLTVIIPNVRTLYQSADDVISVEVENEGIAAQDIATDVTVNLTDSSPADAASTVTLANGIVGATQNTTFNLTIPVDMGTGDTVGFDDLPLNIDITNAAYTSDTFGGAGAFTCVPSGQDIACTATGVVSAGTGSIVMTGITGAYEASGQALATTVITDTGNGSTALDTTSITITDTIAATLTGTSIGLSTSQKGANATATLRMTLVNELPADGIIEATFPAGFKLSSGSKVSNAVSVDGGFTLAAAGQVLTITRDGAGTATPASTAIELPVFPVINPITVGTTGSFSYEAQTSAANVIDRDAAVGTATITEIPPQPNVNSGGGGGGGGGAGGDSIVAGSYLAQFKVDEAPAEEESQEDEEDVQDDEKVEEGDDDLPGLPSQPEEGEQEGDAEVKESAPEGFSDVSGHWSEVYVNQLADMGYAEGKDETTYAPDDAITTDEIIEVGGKAFGLELVPPVSGTITRAQAIELLVEAVVVADIDQHFADNYSSNEDYWYAALPDVDINAPYAKYVAYAVDFDIIDGYPDGTFGADNLLTRAELAKIVVKLLDYLANLS